MKRICLVVIVLLAMVTVGYGADSGLNSSYSSGNKTADAVIKAGRAVLKRVMIVPDGTNNCSVAIYDNASAATGTVIFPALTCLGNGSGCVTDVDVYASNGLYADMTVAGGGSCTYNVHYR